MERKEFIKKGILSSALAYVYTVFGNTAAAEKILTTSKYRGIEGILSPTNTHMVGNGFKVMNYFPNGNGFEERIVFPKQFCCMAEKEMEVEPSTIN